MQKKAQQENYIKRNDAMLLLAIIFLCAFGLIAIFSTTASKCAASRDFGYDALYYVKRQGLFMLAGFFCIFLLHFFPYRWLKIISVFSYFVGLGMILLLKSPLAYSSGGATRWLNLGFRFQVSEVVKVCCIIFLAYFIDKYKNCVGRVKLTWYLWAFGGIMTVLLLIISSDLSSSAVVFGICYIMSFTITKTIKTHLGLFILGSGAVGGYLWYMMNNLPPLEEVANIHYRTKRIIGWLAPEKYEDLSYQTMQGIYAIARGGTFGKGLGNSLQKSVIPEPHTDFIFSVIAEELGLLGICMLVFLYIYLLFQIWRISISCTDIFGKALTVGIFAHIAVQTVINLGVNVGVLPNTGLPLPFISYGGTSVFVLLAAEISIVFSVQRTIYQKQLTGFRRQQERKRKRR